VVERVFTAFQISGFAVAVWDGAAAAGVGCGSADVLGISWGGAGVSAKRTCFFAYISRSAVFFAAAASFWATALSRIASSVSTSSCAVGSSSASDSSESVR
jgi:hypothetical protein